jgi:hypothetical protein
MKTTQMASGTAILALLGVLACSGQSSRCEERSRRTLEEGERVDGSASGADVLALANVDTALQLTWDPAVVTGVSSVPTRLTRAYARTDAPIERVETEQIGDERIDLSCGVHLRVPATLSLRSDDGTLDDAFDVVIEYDAQAGAVVEESTAEVRVAFEFSDLDSALTPVEAEGRGELVIRAGFEEEGVIGVVSDGGADERSEVAGRWHAVP